MQASLIDVLLFVIRALALHGFVPLGALSGAAQAPQLSYLWSLDFVAAVMSPEFALWYKLAFAVSMTGLLFMTASVGPSSAILMIPRNDMLHTNSSITRYLNDTEATLFPTLLHGASSLNFSRYPLQNEQTLDTTIISKYHWLSTFEHGDDMDRKVSLVRLVRLGSAEEIANEGGIIDLAIATVPTTLSSRQLIHSTGFKDDLVWQDFLPQVPYNANWTLQTWQPVVMATCTPTFAGSNEAYYLDGYGSQKPLTDLPLLWQKLRSGENANSAEIPSTVSPWIPLAGDLPSLIGVVFNRRKPGDGVYETADGPILRGTLQLCTVTSFWRYTTTTLRLHATRVDFSASTNTPLTRAAVLGENMTPITINTDGMLSLRALWQRFHSTRALEDGTHPSFPALYIANTLAWVPALGRESNTHVAGTACRPDFEFAKGYNKSDLNESSRLSQFHKDLWLWSWLHGYRHSARACGNDSILQHNRPLYHVHYHNWPFIYRMELGDGARNARSAVSDPRPSRTRLCRDGLDEHVPRASGNTREDDEHWRHWRGRGTNGASFCKRPGPRDAWDENGPAE